MALALTALFIALLAGCGSARPAKTAAPPPEVPVVVAPATQEAVPVQIKVVGTVEPFSTVQVKSLVAGEITAVRFTEGGNVNQGDLLFEIDRRPYDQALRQAEGAVAKDRAQLNQAEANLARDRAQVRSAEADAARYRQLAAEGIAPSSQADQFRTTADVLRESIRASEAAVGSARAAMEGDQAAVDRARLDLSYCQIRSPVSGRAGNLLVHAGNLVKANGDTPLVVINRIAPIFVSFGVPERHLAAVRRHSAATKLPVRVSPQNEPDRTLNGTLAVVDNTVDPATGTIRLKATFENREHVLWPGQFVDVTLTLDTRSNAVLVPAEAVQAGQKGQFLYVVKPDRTVEPRNVTVGESSGGKIIVETGVAPGETVVTDGQLRLFPGARVKTVAPGKLEPQAL